MNLKVLSSITVLALTGVLASCGGGGSSDSSTTDTTTSALQGVFLDAPTKGLTYSASPSGLSGITSENGTYQYQAGDTVTFSLDAGATTPIAIGSTQPVAPDDGGAAQTFVLSLPNGQQVAQVLQALNHGSASVLDVSGLKVPEGTIGSLNSYIKSGVLGQTDTTLLASAQSSAELSSGGAPTFVATVDSGFADTVSSHLQVSLNNLSATSSSTPVDVVLSNKIMFRQVITPHAIDLGFSYLSGGGIANVDEDPESPNAGTIYNNSYAATPDNNKIVMTESSSGGTETLTFPYIDSHQALVTFVASNGDTGSGTFLFMKSLTVSMIAGKTIDFPESVGHCDAGHPFQMKISDDGATFTGGCKDTQILQASGTVSAPNALPGIVAFADEQQSGPPFVSYFGLVSGTVDSGSMAVVSPHGVSGIFNVNAE